MGNDYPRRARSQGYQQFFAEISYSNDMMESFMNEDSISGRLTGGFSYDESLLELEDALKVEFWRVVKENLTERQLEVIELYKNGKTQQEIAKLLKVNQSSVTKSLNGNTSYNKKNSGNTYKKYYGGSAKKLKKAIESDEKIIEILQKMSQIREEKW